MDGWQTIKEIRVEMNEASGLAKTGQKSTAYACMLHAKSLLEKYCKKERGPEYGFEKRNSYGQRKGNGGT